MEGFQILQVRKRAHKPEGEVRIKMFDENTGEPKLVNPATPGTLHEPWPLAGVVCEGPPPEKTACGMSWLRQAISEGWAELHDQEVHHAPAGPPEDPWRSSHTFYTGSRVVFHFDDGDVRYRILENPGKYTDAEPPRVEWRYLLELDNG